MAPNFIIILFLSSFPFICFDPDYFVQSHFMPHFLNWFRWKWMDFDLCLSFLFGFPNGQLSLLIVIVKVIVEAFMCFVGVLTPYIRSNLVTVNYLILLI